MKDISLIGFMGCGKSSVGKILATLLPECRLIDLDTYIEEKQGKNIPEIFNEYGEAAFRRMEREALEEIFSDKSRPRAILSLGGGTVTSEQCRQLIRQHTDCFYLRATTDTLLDNLEGHSDGRPMLNPVQPARFDASTSSATDEEYNVDNRHSNSLKMSEPVAERVVRLGSPTIEAQSTETSSEREALRHRIESLMQTRSPQYIATANHIIDINGQTFAQIAEIIKEAVEANSLNIK
jgi:shikimate kinase